VLRARFGPKGNEPSSVQGTTSTSSTPQAQCGSIRSHGSMAQATNASTTKFANDGGRHEARGPVPHALEQRYLDEGGAYSISPRVGHKAFPARRL